MVYGLLWFMVYYGLLFVYGLLRRGIPAPPSPLVLPPLIKNLYFVPFSLFSFFLRYAVEGTLAAEVKNEPDQIPTMEGRMIPRKCAVKYVYLYLNGLYGKIAYYGQNKLLMVY